MIRVVDFEATGLDPEKDRVCEVGFCDLERGPDYDWMVARTISCLCDPGIPIPPEASAIHHLVDSDVRGKLPFDPEALQQGIDAPIFAAHYAKAERGFIGDRLPRVRWICTLKAALRLWPLAPGHSVQVLRYWRNPAGIDREAASPAHRAGPDSYVTAHLLIDLLQYATVEQLIEWTDLPVLQVICRIGKDPPAGNRGLLWRDVEWSFLRWVSERDFDEDVLYTVKCEMERREAEEQAKREGETDPVTQVLNQKDLEGRGQRRLFA